MVLIRSCLTGSQDSRRKPIQRNKQGRKFIRNFKSIVEQSGSESRLKMYVVS